MRDPDVLIVGAGPAGLAAAAELARLGRRNVRVIDRDDAAGGLPRFCAHPGFGLGYLAVPRSGPAFADVLVRRVADTATPVMCSTTMISIEAGPAVTVTGPQLPFGVLRPKAVILATGVREASRGNRLVPGDRPPSGILTTGLLQQMVARRVPFPSAMRDLVVVGTEHVSFSAIWTARHAGLRVRAMIEEGPGIASVQPAAWIARAFGVEIRLRSRVAAIRARGPLPSAVEVETDGRRTQIACQGVVFTAGWIPEVAALAAGPIALDDVVGGVRADASGRTSLDGVFAAGNLRHPLKASGACAREGRRVAAAAAAHLRAIEHGR
jgi:thioredoxin reductase